MIEEVLSFFEIPFFAPISHPSPQTVFVWGIEVMHNLYNFQTNMVIANLTSDKKHQRYQFARVTLILLFFCGFWSFSFCKMHLGSSFILSLELTIFEVEY